MIFRLLLNISIVGNNVKKNQPDPIIAENLIIIPAPFDKKLNL